MSQVDLGEGSLMPLGEVQVPPWGELALPSVGQSGSMVAWESWKHLADPPVMVGSKVSLASSSSHVTWEPEHLPGQKSQQ
jgi:hypothetical protein